MATNYAQMTADLIARMRRAQEHVLCSGCHVSFLANQATPAGKCPGCGADDDCTDVELDAVTRQLAAVRSEVSHA